MPKVLLTTVKLGDKEWLEMEQPGIKELFLITNHLLLDKELLSILKMQKLGVRDHEIAKIIRKRAP
jgi:hypothetical protein